MALISYTYSVDRKRLEHKNHLYFEDIWEKSHPPVYGWQTKKGLKMYKVYYYNPFATRRKKRISTWPCSNARRNWIFHSWKLYFCSFFEEGCIFRANFENLQNVEKFFQNGAFSDNFISKTSKICRQNLEKKSVIDVFFTENPTFTKFRQISGKSQKKINFSENSGPI